MSISVAALLAAALCCSSQAADWRSVRPAGHAGTTRLTVDSKKFTYYTLTSESGVSFTIEGPVRIKILTRLRMPEHVETAGYGVSVIRNGVEIETVEVTTEPSGRAHYANLPGFIPGEIRRLYIDVPTGRHAYVLTADRDVVVESRIFAPIDTRPKLVSIAPRQYAGVEILLYKDKELTYYILNRGDPMVLDVVGTTTIKVNTRLLFDHTMMSGQIYAIGVREVGGTEQLYRIEARPSETIDCRDRDTVVPGALRDFTLDVGEGLHTYEFRLADGVAREIALKFYLPRGDLANEP